MFSKVLGTGVGDGIGGVGIDCAGRVPDGPGRFKVPYGAISTSNISLTLI